MPAAPKNSEPWYKDGLRFKCTGCGDCCTGAPGYVWVNKAEIAALAAEVELSVAEFERKYIRKIGIRKSLAEYSDGDCVFFDLESRGCRVYAARPRQCRTWPFWDSNLKSAEAWEETCQECPGSGKGKLYQLDDIEAARKTFHV
ncbi:Flagellin N-methylase [Posidoniimonas polymericola]|uniref:Flagellin N-methylase n=1 Tax=Posidoniimonas polymericola TaxID=2528002 RepID=A0A5C5XXQ3_9BACT|nr:YkgJ family cysteine cluster protein [Posidoniimonas polymericola]TWT67654.1 Flagellin N-methylase [Posidoniimonas polymericola]